MRSPGRFVNVYLNFRVNEYVVFDFLTTYIGRPREKITPLNKKL